LDGKKRQHIIFAGIFLVLQIVFIWRSYFGFNTSDEMYFIGTAERIFRGEKVLIDEWNPTQQLCSFLLHPVYCLLRVSLGSTEGIVMAARFLYLAFAAVVSLFLYLRFQRRGYMAYGPALLFLIFAPFSICAMSYNTLEFAILTVLLAVLSADMEHSVPEYLLCGILAAIVVLANPYAVVMYAGYGAVCLIATLRGRKKGKTPEGVLQFKNYIWMSVGAGILLVLFVFFVFQRGTLSEVMANLPHILGDSEHQHGLWYKTWRYFYLIFKNYRYMFYVLGVVYLATLLDKKRYEHGVLYMAAASAAVIPHMIYYGFIFDHISVNYQMLPLAFWCMEAYFVTRDKEKRLFWGWYVPAALFSLVVQYATNTGIVTLSVAWGICSYVGLIFVAEWFKELRIQKDLACEKQLEKHRKVLLRVGCAGIAVTLAVHFAGTFFQRMTYAWGDNRVWYLTEQMERGPLKGVYTTPEMAAWYADVCGELDMLDLTEDDQIMVFGVAPWIYLYVDANCGNYSTWQVHENSTQLYTYYALHPDKFPNVIYMAHWQDKFVECELADMFKDKGYEVVYDGVGRVMMSPERIASWKKQ